MSGGNILKYIYKIEFRGITIQNLDFVMSDMEQDTASKPTETDLQLDQEVNNVEEES
jgi:hypothetical protein